MEVEVKGGVKEGKGGGNLAEHLLKERIGILKGKEGGREKRGEGILFLEGGRENRYFSHWTLK